MRHTTTFQPRALSSLLRNRVRPVGLHNEHWHRSHRTVDSLPCLHEDTPSTRPWRKTEPHIVRALQLGRAPVARLQKSGISLTL